MKKSELKTIIKEVIQEEILNEGNYIKNEIAQAVKKHKKKLDPKNNDYGYGKMAMQIRGDGGSTKWLSLTPEEAIKIGNMIEDD